MPEEIRLRLRSCGDGDGGWQPETCDGATWGTRVKCVQGGEIARALAEGWRPTQGCLRES